MSDGVQILVAAFTSDERAEALDYVRGLGEVARPGPWRELLLALEADLVAGEQERKAQILRLARFREQVKVRGVRWGDGEWSGEAPPEAPS